MLEPPVHSRGLEAAAHTRRAQGTQPEALPDLLLIERVRAGDDRAIEALIRRYSRRLMRAALSVVLDEERAEAAVLEAYLAAFSDLNRCEPAGRFAAWLTRLTFNQARAQRLGARAAGPSAPAADADTARALEYAIAQLPEVFRSVYVLRMIEGVSGIETAASLGLHETTVRTRLFRAHRRLGAEASRRAQITAGLFEPTAACIERLVSRALSRLHHGSIVTICAGAP